jgi:predicted ATPase/class 3 adenylate cyclase
VTDAPEDSADGATDGTAATPIGTVTFLFTDIEGSTRLWEDDPSSAADLVAGHDRVLRGLVTGHRGRVVKGTGDGILAAFASANDALEAAVAIQLELQGGAATIRARIALHTGEAELRGDDYFGAVVNRCSRVLSAAHGDQILLTLATAEVLSRPLPEGVGLVDLGRHRLRDLPEAIHLYQVTHPRLRSDFPPLRGSESFAHNLPVQLTSFVGRERELAEAGRALRASRLVTLTGVGGGGKSRLATQLASDVLGEFPSGAWMVALAYAREPELVDRSIAGVLGVPEEPGRSLRDSIAVRLRQAPALLVLDNCEHLIEACAESVRFLLRAVPGLKILATSRERLGVEGEALYVVPPMSVPSEEDARDPERALSHDAVHLFVERARLAAPHFRVTSETSPAVGRICRTVDGIPLAIELAAGRVGSLTVDQIAARLESRLDVVGGGLRTAGSRHETMVATLDWSYDLLSPQEREILAQLAAFHGSFDLAQVEAVCIRGGDDEPLSRIMALLDKSLLTRDATTGRYRLLEPVRRYVWDKVAEQGWHDELARSHAVYFTELAERLLDDVPRSDRPDALDRLELEHDNIRAALRWSLDQGEGELALRIASAAWPFWKLRGHHGEGRRWLEQALDMSPDVPAAVLAHALRGAGDLAAGQSDYDRARDHLERSLLITEQIGNDAEAAAILTRLAGLPHRRGDLQEATRLFEDALERARHAGEPSSMAHILASLALLAEDQGERAAAETYAAEALDLRRRTNDLYAVTDALLAQGEISINRGDWGAAYRALDEALQASSDAGFADVAAWATAYLGKLALAQAQPDHAENLLSKALAMFQRLGMPVGAAWAMRHLGRAALAAGDPERADALLSEAVRISLDEVRPDFPLAIQALAEVKAQQGDWEEAAVLAGSAAAARETMGLHLPPAELRSAEAIRDELAARLGRERLDELTALGASLTLEEAAAHASHHTTERAAG